MTLTTAKRGSLCCASFKLSAHDGFSFTSALQCQHRRDVRPAPCPGHGELPSAASLWVSPPGNLG